MENKLKVTNVFSDPTRYKIYEFILNKQKPVKVVDVAEAFSIHPNVARAHLAKLEEVGAIMSFFEKTGQGGRPSRLYQLSDKVIELHFPHRDYQLLAKIALESFSVFGEAGKKALYQTGKKYGAAVIEEEYNVAPEALNPDQKIRILEDASHMLGMYADFTYDPELKQLLLTIKNCPIKEVAERNPELICKMHHAFLKGMIESLFEDIELIEEENMFAGCENCAYVVNVLTGA